MKRALLGASLLLSIQSYAASQPDTGVFSISSIKDVKIISVDTTQGKIKMLINKIDYTYVIAEENVAQRVQATIALKNEIMSGGALEISYKKREDWNWEITDITTHYGDYKAPRSNRLPVRKPSRR